MHSLTHQELQKRLGLQAGCIPKAQRCSPTRMNSLTKLLLFLFCAVSLHRELVCVSTRHSLGMPCVKWYENNEIYLDEPVSPADFPNLSLLGLVLPQGKLNHLKVWPFKTINRFWRGDRILEESTWSFEKMLTLNKTRF